MGRVTPAKPEIGGVGPSEIVGARNLKAIKTCKYKSSIFFCKFTSFTRKKLVNI